ncbi:50S ribosomal protein L5 [Methanoregula sp.]|jgi:large subunit ribosomal protein L5|uniref:50S ribosomal protein L5 n=1 Tax=Methanoregula sp. TaxID=2052170 RepID=UPI0025EF0D2A|nr:50S ribosomal protein L5 [Methanoregula sp.]
MREIHIDKVVVHMGVGESGEKLVKAENIMKTITKQTPIRSIAKMTQPAFNIRKGAPIGCKVTLRGKTAEDFIKTALNIVNKTIFESQFDKSGNFSFGIEEHTDFPGMSYDPQIGIFGMDVNVVLERNGIRITRRRMQKKKLPEKQRVKKEDAVAFLKEAYSVEVR